MYGPGDGNVSEKDRLRMAGHLRSITSALRVIRKTEVIRRVKRLL